MEKKKVLVAEHEPSLLDFMAVNLEGRGFNALKASSSEQVLALFQSAPPDLVLLDFDLLESNWREIFGRIRQRSSVPILMLLTQATLQNRIQVLNEGADGYLLKPFTIDELEAHILALFRRVEASQQVSLPTVLRYQELALDTQLKFVLCRGEPIKLTPLEFTFLHYMMQHPHQLIDHERLLNVLWGEGHDRQPKHLRVYVKRLRQKIELDPANPDYLRSEYGLGYRLGEPIPTETMALSRVHPLPPQDFDRVKMLKRLVESLLVVLSVDRCELLVTDEKSEYLRLFTSAGYGAEQDSPSRQISLDQGLVGWCVRHNRFLALNSGPQDPRYVSWPDLPVLDEGSIAMMPTSGPDDVQGILVVYALTGNGFEPEIQALLHLFANQLGILLSQTKKLG